MYTRLEVMMILLILCLSGCGKSVQFSAGEMSDYYIEDSDMEDSGSDAENQEELGEPTQTTTIFVYVCGAVVSPGVYEINRDARICDVIFLAGGMTQEADPNQVNQAQWMEDGQRIYIPAVGEQCETVLQEDSQAAKASDGLVNINTADIATLMTLSGIGNARAVDIVKYREENGNFKTIEELMHVPGIKTGIFNKLKDSISVGN